MARNRLERLRPLAAGIFTVGALVLQPAPAPVRAEAARPAPARVQHVDEQGQVQPAEHKREPAKSNPYEDASQCTFLAWEMAAKAGHKLPQFGNARDWAPEAKDCGYNVVEKPGPEIVGSVAVWDAGVDGASWAGHVAWVTAVDGNRFKVQERNWGWGDSERWVDWQPGISFITFANEERNLHVTQPLALSARSAQAGQKVSARFTIKNEGKKPLRIDDLVAAGRRGGPDGPVADFAHVKGVTLLPGQEHTYNQPGSFAAAGEYVFRPMAQIGGRWVNLDTAAPVALSIQEAGRVNATRPASLLGPEGKGAVRLAPPQRTKTVVLQSTVLSRAVPVTLPDDEAAD